VQYLLELLWLIKDVGERMIEDVGIEDPDLLILGF
jgi:hypothetical protein